MTAVPTCDGVGPTGTDAELARAAAGGDRTAFAGIYDRYADRLHDFCVGMLRDRDGAADCVQDTFCIAATRLTQLRDPDKLRPWLYSIARNEALRRLRDRRRETPSDELPDTVSDDPGPDTLAARTALADLIAEAAGGLSDRDRCVLELAYRHGVDGPELAEALGVSLTNANKMVSRLRHTIENSLGALLVSHHARNTPDGCPALAAFLGDWDGRFSILMRKRISRHIESCPTCDQDRQRLVSPAALLGAAPVFIPAPPPLRERTLSDIRLTCLGTPIAADTVKPAAPDGPNAADPHGRRTRNAILLIALLIATLLISLGLTIAWVYNRNTTVTPTDLTDISSTSLSTTPAAPTASSPPASPTESSTTVPGAPEPSSPLAPPTGGGTTVAVVTAPPAQVTSPVQPPVTVLKVPPSQPSRTRTTATHPSPKPTTATRPSSKPTTATRPSPKPTTATRRPPPRTAINTAPRERSTAPAPAR